MNKLLGTCLKLFLLVLLPIVGSAQTRPRQILHGIVISDSLKVENITVLNTTSNIGAITDNEGNFSIYARPADTLFFSGLTFRSARLVLKDDNFGEEKVVIKLDVNVITLDEVVITPNVLSGALDKDSNKTKTQNLSGFNSADIIKTDFPRQKAPVNTAMPATESSLQGIDFKEIYKMIFKKKRKKDKGEIYASQQKSFTETIKKRFSHHFFTQTLKIPHEEIGLFISFCDKEGETARLLDPKNEFELTDYLVTMAAEYLKKDK